MPFSCNKKSSCPIFLLGLMYLIACCQGYVEIMRGKGFVMNHIWPVPWAINCQGIGKGLVTNYGEGRGGELQNGRGGGPKKF